MARRGENIHKRKDGRWEGRYIKGRADGKAGVLLQMELGLRIGEVCGLKWSDFDLKNGILTIQRTVCRIPRGDGHTNLIVQTPKTRKSTREIPLFTGLVAILRKLSKDVTPDTWFLSGTESRPVEPRCYRKSIRCYLKRAATSKR